MGITTEEFEGMTLEGPEHYCYTDDYEAGVDFVLEQTRQTAEDDKRKMFTEFFDDKFRSLGQLIAEVFFNRFPLERRFDRESSINFEFWVYETALLAIQYDSILLVWREKIRYNRVRPTNVVRTLRKDEVVTTFAGPGEGEKDINGFDWQPYIRTMPQAEYPSGSACLCQATADFQVLWGGDAFPSNIPVITTFEAGSSFVEPGVTPSEAFSHTWSSWSEVADMCSNSRLWGGMHFEGAIEAARDLCGDNRLATPIWNRMNPLIAGDESGKLLDFVFEFDVRSSSPGKGKGQASNRRLKKKKSKGSSDRHC